MSSKNIDERVVRMEFDNGKFEKNANDTLSTLDKLKEKLRFKDAGKGIEEVGATANKFHMNGMSSAIETVHAKFSALQVIGITTLTNLTNQAINTGKRMISALTIDPVKTGFQEYETQIGAIQTILANTQSKGSTLQDVNRALAELNTYADKTIYNFTEMTRNIGTFTAAGVDLDKSVTSIKGIANLAAVSGSTSMQASTAMYQLSQALATGTVKLQDWNSVVNAGMGGELFQNALKRTATHMGKDVEAIIEAEGSFRDSLSKGEWLTTEVLTETLTQLSGAYTEADLIAQGYTEKQAKEIAQLAETAVSAATEVKTFTQLWDTLKEAAQSGWTRSWEIMIGDFGEAKELLTGISNSVGDYLNNSADARNKVLSEGLSTGWKQMLNQGIANEEGFKETIKSTAKEHGVAVEKMIKDSGSFEKSLKQGWITGDILSESLDKMTKKVSGMSQEQLKAAGYTTEQARELQALNKAVKDGTVNLDEFAKKMAIDSGRENVLSGLTNIFKALGDAIAPVKEAFRDIFPSMTGNQLYEITEKFRKFTETLKISETTTNNIKRTAQGLFSIFDLIGKGIKTLLSPIIQFAGSGAIGGILDTILKITASIGDFFTALNKSKGMADFFNTIGNTLAGMSKAISDAIKTATNGIDGFGDILSKVGNKVGDIAKFIGDILNKLFGNISGFDIFAGLTGGGIFVVAKKFKGILDLISNPLEKLFGDKGKEKASTFKEIMESVHDTLTSFTTSIKTTSLLSIATAIAVLSSAISKISKVDIGDLTKSLAAIGVMFKMLTASFGSISKSISKYGSQGILKSSISLIAVAAAIDIFAKAMTKVASLDLEGVAKGLISLGSGLAMFVIAAKQLGKIKISISTSVAILAIAESTKALAESLSKFGKMSWDEIGRGLTSMGMALSELSGTLIVLDKFSKKSLSNSVSILILVKSLSDICDAMAKFGKMSWDEIGRGLTAMGGALAELSGALSILGKFGKNNLSSSVSMVIVSKSLDDISEAMLKISKMSWDEIGRGLTAMGGALAEIGVVTGSLGHLAGFSGILGSTSILITVQSLEQIVDSLKRLGIMSWDEIGKGLTAMGGALAEIGVITGSLGYLTGMAGILGAATIWVAIQGLEQLADAFTKFSSLSWDEIGRGLTAMGGALLEVSVVSGALGYLTGMAGILGAATIWVSVQGLEKLAEAMKQFGAMSWDEIGRGLVAMGGALSEVSVVSGALGYLTGIAGILGGATIWVSVQGLEKLAESLKKFGSMSWGEIERGISAMGDALSATAWGSLANTLGIIGAMTISEVAGPLGTLADSVKKWKDVVMPATLKDDLINLGKGIKSFNFASIFGGSGAFAEIVTPMGTLADSVKKWKDVVMPATINDDLSKLASGVKSFNFASVFGGSGAFAEISAPLGTLADSVKKWKDVIMPATIGDDLSKLGSGIKSFNFASVFGGVENFAAIVSPLGTLADSVKKWKDVIVPSTIEEDLSHIASGVKSFRVFLGDSGAQSIATMSEPLGKLAESIMKWKDVKVPENFSAELEKVSLALMKFKQNSSAFANINTFAEPLGKLADSVKKWEGVKVPDGIDTGLANLGKGIKEINVSPNLARHLSNVGDAVSSICNGMKELSGIDGSNIAANITSVLDSIKNVSIPEEDLKNLGVKVIDKIIAGIESTSERLTESAKNLILTTARELEVVKENFVKVGEYLVMGFASGIDQNEWRAEAAAKEMAKAAKTAAEKELDEHSPSKVGYHIGDYFGIGFVNGIDDNVSNAYSTSADMAHSAKSGLSKAISKISDLINSDIDMQPTIRPVLDISGVASGANSINSLLNGQTMTLAANAGSINTMMNRRIQNGANSDVIAAINNLNKELKNIEKPSYNVGNITYDDGSNIGEAIESLVRAIKMDRRS